MKCSGQEASGSQRARDGKRYMNIATGWNQPRGRGVLSQLSYALGSLKKRQMPIWGRTEVKKKNLKG